MLENYSPIPSDDVNIASDKLILIKSYLQGAVYCWCKTNQTEEFCLASFCGRENSDWRRTPLQALYDYWYKQLGEDDGEAKTEASKNAGRILLRVLYEDKRTFRVKKGSSPNIYHWNNTIPDVI